MDAQINNMQKYANYKEQFGRLKKAITNNFFLEAIFIEYAIIEDRLESILRHSGNYNPKRHLSLNSKLHRVSEMSREAKGLTMKYFSGALLAEISAWKEERNKLIHALMKQKLHAEDLEVVALQGQLIAKTISNKTKSYNTALRKKQLEGEK